ncbi:MAG: two-component system, cell cycle response regulator DivK [Chloroflexota bacterium]|nr:two-component system, cell cycle response regulator DivK [Chloroflexota bacterium]
MNPPTAARVLVAEDNDMNYELISDVLEMRGFDVLRAADGEEALRLARSEPFAALVLDLHMPKLSGSDLLDRLRADAATRDVKVMILTADAMNGVRDRLLSAGADAFMTKPFHIADFVTELQALIV